MSDPKPPSSDPLRAPASAPAHGADGHADRAPRADADVDENDRVHAHARAAHDESQTSRADAGTEASDGGAGPDEGGSGPDDGGHGPDDGGHGPDDGAAPGPSGGEAGSVEGDIDELLKLTAQRDDYLSLAQRTQADFENYRKRVAREAKQSVERGVVKLAKELLPALDNLDRAITHAASEDPLLEGVRLVRAEIGAALGRVGVESFSPIGESFDPTLHEAVASVEQPEGGAASGSVAEVYQDGYRLGETIIRPARVVVAA